MASTSSNESNEDMRSDGSDFGSESGMDLSDGSSFNSTNYDMDGVDETGPELVPPPPPRWDQMSVETLQELIEKHKQSNTVGAFLCEIDRDSNFYIPVYFESAILDDDEIPRRYIQAKTYYTMLGFACLDPDGERGEEKIKIILQTVKRLRREMIHVLVTFSRKLRRRTSDREFVEDCEGRTVTTPLHLLIGNQLATIGSFKLICRAWPRVVHVRGDECFKQGTILSSLVVECVGYRSGGERIDLLKARTKILLEAAENTKEGARGLILASDKVNVGETRHRSNPNNLMEQTVIHVATTDYKNPEKVLPLFLKWWPECLEFICEEYDGGPSYPFHNVFCRPSCKDSVVKSFEVFAQYSTLVGMATALLHRYDRRVGDSGFDLLLDLLEGPSLDADPDMKAYLGQVVRTLLHRRDALGRTLLHYVMAHQVSIADWESWKFDSKFAIRELEKTGRAIPYEWRDYATVHAFDDSVEMPEGLAVVVDEFVENHKLKMMADVTTVTKWIIGMDHSLAFVVDENGKNPFHFAVSKGKRWNKGLSELYKLEPKWADASQSGTHFPFLLAAVSSNDDDDDDDNDNDGQQQLDTIFELLRFDASVLRFFTP